MDIEKRITDKVRNTIKEYSLLDKKEDVLVALSGGKDSISVLYILKNLGYKVSALTIDLNIGDYTKKNVAYAREFCKEHSIPYNETSLRKEFGYSLCYIRSILNSKGLNLKSCTICGILRRYLINRIARELKADKLVTGHNIDDEVQSVMMNILRNDMSLMSRIGPISGISKDIKFVPRVKPLYFCKEEDIVKFSKKMGFDVVYESCPCSVDVYRRFVLNTMDAYEKEESDVKSNVIKNFIKIMPSLKKEYKAKDKFQYCEVCKEPSKNEVCKTCKLISILKPNQANA